METLLAVLTSMMLSYAPYNATDVLIDRDEAFCLAQNVYHEAKGENLAGKSAVAHVTLNRVAHKKYPNTICGVTRQAKLRTNWRGNQVPVIGMCQFSWYCDGKKDVTRDGDAWRLAQEIAYRVVPEKKYRGITEGATHYHATYVSPKWAPTLDIVGRIGQHIFYRWP